MKSSMLSSLGVILFLNSLQNIPLLLKLHMKYLTLIQIMMNCYSLLPRESEGLFQYGNYHREADDLRDVVQHFYGGKRVIIALVGHSKGLSIYIFHAQFIEQTPQLGLRSEEMG